MATYGQLTTGGGVANSESRLTGNIYTIGAAGETPASVDVYLNESTTANAHTVKVTMHRVSDGAFIAETNARSDIATGGAAQYSFTFTTNPSLSAVGYYVSVYANSAAGNLDVDKDDAASDIRWVHTGLTYPTVPDPSVMVDSGDTSLARLQLTTNDPSGSAFPSPIYQAMMLA